MYTRNYYGDGKEMRIPENYDGTAILKSEEDGDDMVKKDDFFSGVKISPNYKEEAADSPEKNEMSENDRQSVFKNIFSKDQPISTLMPQIGPEELLILGLAAFLFFSKSGDKECAFLLLILIFIK